jgi:copper chaperone CopZ
MSMKKTVKINGMHCPSCAFLIEGELEDIGVKSTVSYQKGEAVVEFDEKKVKEEQINTAIRTAGYKVVN